MGKNVELADRVGKLWESSRGMFQDLEKHIEQAQKHAMKRAATCKYNIGLKLELAYEEWMQFGEEFLVFEKKCREAQYNVGLSYFMERKFAFDFKAAQMEKKLDDLERNIKRNAGLESEFLKDA